MRLRFFLAACFATAPVSISALSLPRLLSWQPQTTPVTTSNAKSSHSYIISPAADVDPTFFVTTIETLVKPQVPQVFELPDLSTGAQRQLLWVASLTDAQVEDIKRNSAVAGLAEHEEPTRFLPNEQEEQKSLHNRSNLVHNLDKRAGDRWIYHYPSQDYEMIQLSTPPGQQPGKTYDIEKSAGAGVTVYVIDTPIRLDHHEFSSENSDRTVREIRIPRAHPDLENEWVGPGFHGTCVASKAVGAESGSAPSANLVAVSLGDMHWDTLVNGFDAVIKDVRARGLQGKAVLVLSLNMEAATKMTPFPDRIATMTDRFEQFIALDVVPVVSAGNEGLASPEISSYPAMLAGEMPIIVVGATNSKGSYLAWSQGGPLLTTLAGGLNVLCATPDGAKNYLFNTGTSFATPLIAGMIANWLADPVTNAAFPKGQVAIAAKASVQALHWSRAPGVNLKVAYNGIDECYGANKYENQPRPEGVIPSLTDIMEDYCTLPNIKLQPTLPGPKDTMTPPPPKDLSKPPDVFPKKCYNYDENCDGWCCPDEPGKTCTTLEPGRAGCTCGKLSEGMGRCSWFTFF